jgi:hypothetical protein
MCVIIADAASKVLFVKLMNNRRLIACETTDPVEFEKKSQLWNCENGRICKYKVVNTFSYSVRMGIRVQNFI